MNVATHPAQGDPLYAAVAEYLRSTPLLSRLCRQNGWIDNDSLRFEIQSRSTDTVDVCVQFRETIMEGSGCVAGELENVGYLRLRVGPECRIVTAEIL